MLQLLPNAPGSRDDAFICEGYWRPLHVAGRWNFPVPTSALPGCYAWLTWGRVEGRA